LDDVEMAYRCRHGISLFGGCAAVAPLIPGLIPTRGAKADFHTGTQVKLNQANFTM